MVQDRPLTDPVPDTEPFGLTEPVPYWPTILPLVTTTASLEPAHCELELVRIQAPS